MSAYIKLATLEYPRHEGDIRLDHPEILESQTGDTFPCPDTYAFVQPVEPPEYDPATQIVYESAPEQVDGSWRMVWVLRDKTQEDYDAEARIQEIMKSMFRLQPR